MQIKTIKKVVESKMNEWLVTITDEVLAKDVRSSLLVSGGSICSMLLNEPVNDYDVYIQDINVLKRLCKYYLNISGNPGTILDGREKDNLIENIILIIVGLKEQELT